MKEYEPFIIRKGPMMKATMANSYEGISLTRGDSKTPGLVVSLDKMLDSLVESMTDRFQDASVGVLCATSFSWSASPTGQSQEMQQQGTLCFVLQGSQVRFRFMIIFL